MIEVITIANKKPSESYYCWDAFHDSLERFGYKATVLGWQQDWKGLMSKPRHLRTYLRSGDCKADVISINDSWDSVWQKSPTAAEKYFLELGLGMVIGAEKNCFPDAGLAKLHPECASSFRFVNTGMIIGKPKAILDMLEVMDLDKIPNDGEDQAMIHPNDQHFIMKAYLDGKCDAILDTQTKFVVNLCGVSQDELDWSEATIGVKETGSTPYILHFNGNSKDAGTREPILQKLLLPI